jgi:mitofilin
VKVVQRLTTEANSTPVPPKKKGVVRRILFYSTAVVGTFYVGSAFVAFNSSRYYDFFSENVPMGNSFLEFAESHDWDILTMKDVLSAPRSTSNHIQRWVSSFTSKAKATPDEKAKAAQESKQRVQAVTRSLKTTVGKAEADIAKGSSKAVAIARHHANQFSTEIEDLVQKAEGALSGTTVEQDSRPRNQPIIPSPDTVRREAEETKPSQSKTVYDAPLPVEFEPPPGFARPKLPGPELRPIKEASPPPLPLVEPAVSELSASEPIIVQLATTIDNLASYLNANPSTASKAKGILETAKNDLSALASRIDKVKDDERVQLEQKLDEQTREYTIKLLELEMEAQDKLDSQEDGFRKFFDDEKAKLVQGYREKLEHELKTQTELVNER